MSRVVCRVSVSEVHSPTHASAQRVVVDSGAFTILQSSQFQCTHRSADCCRDRAAPTAPTAQSESERARLTDCPTVPISPTATVQAPSEYCPLTCCTSGSGIPLLSIDPAPLGCDLHIAIVSGRLAYQSG
eukprot:INCI17258.4.p1 GENE.INCI17258.4~~INCI17258.4.p1  ORF type:complete len:130 (-),score=0.23 INCI17258.4:316-705(-)